MSLPSALPALTLLALVASSLACAATAAPPAGGDLDKRVQRLLKKTPLIDGHNDLPWQMRRRFENDLSKKSLLEDTATLEPPMHTDIPRMRKGGVGGQFWSVYVPVSLAPDEAVRVTLEQIDVVHRLCELYPEHFELALTADDIVRIHKAGKIASLIGMEGGHSIGNSLGALRMLYRAGARYMTITHWKNHDWADAATEAPRHKGLTDFGREVIREMNRLGMLIDLSHVSAKTMHDVLDVSEAPVIFSHSGAFATNPHPRNVPDDVLKRLEKRDGVVMVDFLPTYVSKRVWDYGAKHHAERARLEVYHIGDPEGLEAALEAWKKANPAPKSTLSEVVDHIDHIKKVIGVDHIGIGSDYDGMGPGPIGLEDASTYPALLKALLERGYTDDEVAKIAGGNLLRVMRKAEKVAARLARTRQASNLIYEGHKAKKAEPHGH